MTARVYFTKDATSEGCNRIFKKLLEERSFSDQEVALKTHFGEEGNSRFVAPEDIKPIRDLLSEHKLWITDTNTLYRGMRTTATDHKQLAQKHGFGELGLPIVIADGEHGEDEVLVDVNRTHFDSVHIARAIADVSQMVVISHFKGHILFGFGGALKNVGMGAGSRAGKLAMHSKVRPVMGDGCNGCGVCVENCLYNAIHLDEDNQAVITDECVGCARCIAVCPSNVIKVPWHGASAEEAQERCAEYAEGALRGTQGLYVTFIKNLTKDCDCIKDSSIIGDDVGMVASTDPVAIDEAAIELVKEKHGEDIFYRQTGVDGTRIIDCAEQLGLGSKEYDFIDIG